MIDFLIYDAKVAVLIAVFYMFYRLLLSRETFHRVNRIVLLLTAVASFILPFCVITMHETVTMPMPEMHVEMGPLMAEVETPSVPLWQTLLPILFIIGMCATLGHTLLSMIRIILLIRKSEQHPQPDGVTVCVTGNAALSPFSWMHYIVMNREDYETHDSAILAHERGHIRLHHSWDLILVDTLTALQWFNPAMWMLRADLRAIHEYEADAAVLSQGINARQYQYLLITKAAGIGGYSLANGISHSTLKNRINMMLHKKSNRSSLLKLLALLPIVAIALAVNAETVTDVVYTQPQKQMVKKGRKAATINLGSNRSVLQVVETEEPEKAVKGEKFTLKGLVVDAEAAQPVVGAVVKIEGSTKGTVSDREGNFQLEVSDGDIINIMYVGYETISVKVDKSISENRITAYPIGKEQSGTSDGKTFDVVEEMPQFPGGPAALFEFLSKNIQYPKDAEKAKLQGRVIVTFVVKKDGSITDAKVVKSVAPSLDAEALRVINAMPNWAPGRQGGQPVNVKYTVPLTFRLNGNDNKEVAQISNAGSDALSGGETFFVIDDKPATAEEVKQIDPKTIDHMDVLKGESATKLYGEKAKHGAVLIFTKKNQ